MAPVYDLILLLDPEASEDRREQIVADTRAAIERSGSVVTERDWGLRALAYEIRHQPDADYHVFELTGEPELLDELGRTLKITDGVLRHRIIRLRPGAAEPPDLRQPAEIDAR